MQNFKGSRSLHFLNLIFTPFFFYSFQLKSPAVVGGLGTSLTDIRQTNAESELELRGQIEVHIEPDDDSTRAKVRAIILLFRRKNAKAQDGNAIFSSGAETRANTTQNCRSIWTLLRNTFFSKKKS